MRHIVVLPNDSGDPSNRHRLSPRAVNLEVKDRDWVKLKSTEEHAQWIRSERQLVDLFGNDFSRQRVVTDRQADKDSLAKAVLGKHGTFVALTDAEGRFERLVDRGALLEKLAAGTEP